MKKVLSKSIPILFVLTSLLSCQSKEVSEANCDLESMKCYRGYPQSCNFIKECDNVKHRFTKKLCGQAFNEFIQGGNQKSLLKKYSTNILHCFNDREFENFKIDKNLRPKE